MANVIHRTALTYLASVNTPDYPEPTWKHEPSMSAVAGVPSRYWKAPADWNAAGAGPVEMTQGEKDSVDAALLTAARDSSVVARIDNVEDVLRAVVLVLRDELNLHADKINAALTAIDTSTNYSTLKSNIGTVADYPQRTIAQLRTAVRNALGT